MFQSLRSVFYVTILIYFTCHKGTYFRILQNMQSFYAYSTLQGLSVHPQYEILVMSDL